MARQSGRLAYLVGYLRVCLSLRSGTAIVKRAFAYGSQGSMPEICGNQQWERRRTSPQLPQVFRIPAERHVIVLSTSLRLKGGAV
jgi:hypothetical protein